MHISGSVFNGVVDQRELKGYFFKPTERLLFLDVDGVLIDQERTVKNGRNGKDKYVLVPQARTILRRKAKDHIDRIILWTNSSQSLCTLFGKEDGFSKVDMCIAGPSYIDDEGNMIKDLRTFTPRLRNVVAIEDDNCFIPRSRVIYVPIKPKTTLTRRYYEAVEKLKTS